ncbi:MAG: rod shape-determining protein MreC [Gammaproteobacteria bacterium]|nr:rod shape-determining protein MreC [Gammaproteobacteria bacterium]
MNKKWYGDDNYHEIRLFICCTLSFILLALDSSAYFSFMINGIKGYGSLIFTPVYYAVKIPGNLINSSSSYLNNQKQIAAENNILRSENLRLQGMLLQFEAIQQENQRLRDLLKSSEKVSDKLLIAEVVSVIFSPGSQQLVLDQGSNKSVFVGQAVIDANGVVGQVTNVNPLSSRVLAITDINHAIPVEVLRNNIQAIAVGMGSNQQLELMNISNTMDIIVGDILVSSGLGERFPSGYPVGKVIAIDKNPALPFAKIIIEPLAKINQLKEALLVWPGSKVTLTTDYDIDAPLSNLEIKETEKVSLKDTKDNLNKLGETN